METPDIYMRRCLELAQNGIGFVAPNPMVGAILVYKNRIIGEGWHQRLGEAHAEVNCLHSVAPSNIKYISQSTLYVNLEPCAHFGKTPPCADLIIQYQIPKVIIGNMDTFSKVSGRGIEKLRNAGIQVLTNVLEQECRYFNRRFFTVQEKYRPYIVLKWAQSKDGFIAPKDKIKTQLSNALSQKMVHKMRSEEAAILIGYHTATIDNPQLNNRYWTGNQPIRIVIDPQNELPVNLLIFNEKQKTIIFNYKKSSTHGNNQWIKIKSNNNIVHEILSGLSNIESVIIEGGSKTLQLFLNEAIWDEAYIFKTTKILKEGIVAPVLTKNKTISNTLLEEDIVSLHVHEQNRFYV